MLRWRSTPLYTSASRNLLYSLHRFHLVHPVYACMCVCLFAKNMGGGGPVGWMTARLVQTLAPSLSLSSSLISFLSSLSLPYLLFKHKYRLTREHDAFSWQPHNSLSLTLLSYFISVYYLCLSLFFCHTFLETSFHWFCFCVHFLQRLYPSFCLVFGEKGSANLGHLV